MSSFVDFIKFLLNTDGFIPALVSLVGLVLSFVFGVSIPSPEIVQAVLTLLTLVLTAWAGYNGGVRVERQRAG